MKLRSLKVHGFKSFADPTTIEFHDGITAVVGPNGCGKSNIGDAIRWVLGEQRPTAIRGAKMEEAIFQGTVSRRPVNRGSVSLTVSNEDGALPVPFEEVEVGRQIFRDGGSEYSINRSACRLRDVLDLCRDTGLGANAYSIIENRMIDAILSDRAEERRGLFEEAAGIGKYKDRRKAATRRLERAEMDLQRLEAVISEVHSKVRSLARQKGKAQRCIEYRQRRLDVEVAVVRHQLETLRLRLSGVEKKLAGDIQTGAGKVAELGAAEAQYESLRLKEVGAEKERAEVGKALEEVRKELVRWERDLAVADERAAYAERRLAQIDEERGQALQQAETLERDERVLGSDRDRVVAELEELRGVAAARATAAQEVRERLQGARESLDEVETRERDLARRGAQLEGDAEASDAQADELGHRLVRVDAELESAADALSEIESQGDLFSDRLDELSGGLRAAQEEVDACLSASITAREELDATLVTEREAVARVAGGEARKDAIERLERDQEGLDPVAKAALALGDTGILGTLADFIEADAEATAALESHLGSLTRALVLRDRGAVERIASWFAESWAGGGGLVLLPLDSVPSTSGDCGGPFGEVRAHGDGQPWVRALLDGAEASTVDGVAVTEARGIVRVANPGGASGMLERKKQLRECSAELEEATSLEVARRTQRETAQEELAGAERGLEQSRASLYAAEDELRKVHSEVDARSDQQGRMDHLRDELSRQAEGTKVAQARALERAREARDDREILFRQEQGLNSERAEAREVVAVVQEEYEIARSEEARLAVVVARLEGDVMRLSERVDTIVGARMQANERVMALDVEESSLREEGAEARRIRAEGDEATERLFGERTTSEERVREKGQTLQEVADALAVAEKRVREARTAERAASDRRHQLELERQELGGRIERIRERLEGEWGRPLETLLQEAAPVEGEQEALQDELRELVLALDKIGPVNMLAVEEHEEESQRLEFLTEQRQDLVKARNDLRSAIREINKTATELFLGTFEDIRENFRKTFMRLFEGGEADIWFQDEDDPLESPIEIHASPRGKRTQRIDLLSGGERALTALSLLFGIYLVKPSPFCVLDEVDAPLDENNIGRFIKLLQDFKAESQFVVVTHNPRTIEAADWIYGVTMEEAGVSTIVGVKLEEALEAAGAA